MCTIIHFHRMSSLTKLRNGKCKEQHKAYNIPSSADETLVETQEQKARNIA